MSDRKPTDTEFNQIVSTRWLSEFAGRSGLKLIDARSAAHYGAGHIEGAVNWDMNLLRLDDSSSQSLLAFQQQALQGLITAGINTGDRVVFYDDFSGASAARGVWLLDYLGIPGSAMLDGGLSAWVSDGGELSIETPFIEPGAVSINVQSLSESPAGVTLLDTRSDLEHQIGTIPTSIHLEWLQHLTATGHFRSKDELRDLYQSRGMSAQTTRGVITYCGGGYRAAHSYLVLKELGFPVVRNYAPSWGEWGSRGDVPIQRPNQR